MLPEEKANILIVDDRPEGLLALEAVLKSPRYNLIEARSGREALERLCEREFAVILLDVQMPEMDGFQTADRIKENPSWKYIPLIFATAINKDISYIHRGYEAGAVDYILKPFDPFVLKSKVTLLVELHEKNQEIKRQALLLREAERKDRERQLAELELENLRRYQNLADAIPHIIWKAFPDGTTTCFNKVWCDYTGLSLEQSSVEAWKSAVHPADLERYLTLWQAAMKSEQNFETELRIKGRAGDAPRWHLLRVVAEKDKDGKLAGWIGTSTDIQNRKESEEESIRLYGETQNALAALAERTRALEQSNRDLEQFASVASHDLQEPLQKIQVFANLLQEMPALEPKTVEYLNRMHKAATRMRELINDVLEFSKVTHKAEVFAEVDLNSVVQDVLASMDHQSSDGLITVEIGTLPTLYAHRGQLTQLLQNLIGNAIKFHGTEPPLVHVSARLEGEECIVAIRDNGIGIDPEHTDRIFNIFQRLHPRDKYPGTGIGLAICKRIVERHEGRIWVESEVGKGSTFYFSLPLKRSSESNDPFTGASPAIHAGAREGCSA
jgi:PAS domain S-box-containing protein